MVTLGYILLIAACMVTSFILVTLAILMYERLTRAESYAPAEKPVILTSAEEVTGRNVLSPVTRREVFARIARMQDEPTVYKARPDIYTRESAVLPDYLMCAGRCFGFMFECEKEAYKLVLRLDVLTAERWSALHPTRRSTIIQDEEWFSFSLEHSYSSAEEVFSLIDAAYFYTYDTFYSNLEFDVRAELFEFDGISRAALRGVTTSSVRLEEPGGVAL